MHSYSGKADVDVKDSNTNRLTTTGGWEVVVTRIHVSNFGTVDCGRTRFMNFAMPLTAPCVLVLLTKLFTHLNPLIIVTLRRQFPPLQKFPACFFQGHYFVCTELVFMENFGRDRYILQKIVNASGIKIRQVSVI